MFESYMDKDKPKNVFFGGVLLYTAYVFEMGYSWLQGINVLDFLFYLFLVGYLIFLVTQGKLWARIVILIITILKTFFTPYNFWNFIENSPPNKIELLSIILVCVDYILELVATILLFSKPANIWYNRKRVVIST